MIFILCIKLKDFFVLIKEKEKGKLMPLVIRKYTFYLFTRLTEYENIEKNNEILYLIQNVKVLYWSLIKFHKTNKIKFYIYNMLFLSYLSFGSFVDVKKRRDKIIEEQKTK